MPPLVSEIRFDNVSFAYDIGRPVLHDIDIVIRKGEHVALVGPSGSGKSTVVSLLLRMWDPIGGRITVDGHDIRDVGVASLRAQTATVFQDTFLFDTSVRENLKMGVSATDDELLELIDGVKLGPFIASRPEGLDALLGERGARMSGGQRQRLAIARALLRRPSILILDEATSALDAQTEAEITEAVLTRSPECTKVSVTHRLALAARADRIYVLDAGAVVEEGTHGDLLARKGLYRRLYDEQASSQVAQVTAALAPSLARIPLFAGMSEADIAAAAGLFCRERYREGDVIVRQGDIGAEFYVVQSGRAEVIVHGQGDERRIAMLGPGEYFGEMALLSEAPRAASVIASESTRVFCLEKADFEALMDRHPVVRAAIAGAMKERRQTLDESRRVDAPELVGVGPQRAGRGTS